jgi:hypothetical protein
MNVILQYARRPLSSRNLSTAQVWIRVDHQHLCLTSGQLRQRSLSALAVGRSRDLGRRSVALAHTLVLLADLLGNTTRAADGSGIAVVGVDAHEVGGNAVDLDVADHDIAWATVVGAVATAAVDLTDVDESRVLDGHGSTAVVLNDLVAGRGSSATLPEDVTVSER